MRKRKNLLQIYRLPQKSAQDRIKKNDSKSHAVRSFESISWREPSTEIVSMVEVANIM